MKKTITAHRGLNHQFPENTLVAFKHAVDVGSDMLELDVQFTKDHQLVVVHDDELTRLTTHHEFVGDLTLEQIQSNPLFGLHSDANIPSLQSVLNLLTRQEFCGCLNIEFKTDRHRYSGIEAAVSSLIQNKPRPFDHLYSSFNLSSLTTIAHYEPETELAWIMRGNSELFTIAAQLDLIQAIHPKAEALMQSPTALAHYPKKIRPWTVNDTATAEEFLNMPAVSGIITDVADKMVTLNNHYEY
ncbi:MAG: glycerophosphodiester phosphodiesterase [Lactobacillus sp.]|jgi:glycerophosphoryl diester phosphodiesterase|nr:glycerophosphodiester phosphodiesterase [Lactobacillus sp.]